MGLDEALNLLVDLLYIPITGVVVHSPDLSARNYCKKHFIDLFVFCC